MKNKNETYMVQYYNCNKTKKFWMEVYAKNKEEAIRTFNNSSLCKAIRVVKKKEKSNDS